MQDIIRDAYVKHRVGQAKLYQIVKKQHPAVKLAEIQQFYNDNIVEQRYKQPSKVKEHTHLIANGPNDIHQIDLVKMDKDRGYEHFIVIIDVFSRYAKALPLKSKSAKNVAAAIDSIYSEQGLDYPNMVMLDQGKEFMAETKKLFEDHKVRILMNISTDKRFTSVVERMNKTIETPLFKDQAEQELSKPTQSDVVKPVIKWKDNLEQYIDAYNDQPHSLLRSVLDSSMMTPNEAMEHPESVTYDYPLIEDNRPMLKVGTYVKLPFARTAHTVRHMMETYSNKLYVIIRVKPATIYQPTRYYIADIDELTTLPTSFYRDELNPVGKPKDIDVASTSAPTKLPKRMTTREIEEELYESEPEPDADVTPQATNRRGRAINKPLRYRTK